MFRCATSTGVDLCFNNGTCKIVIDSFNYVREICVCPPGWNPDNVAIHNDNCTLPDYALLALLIFVSLETLICLYLLYRVHSQAKDKALKILKLSYCIVIVFWFEILAIYLENGWFTATSCIVFFVTILTVYWGLELNEIVAMPIFSLNTEIRDQMKIGLQLLYTLVCCLLLGFCLALAITAYEVDKFNLVAIAYNLAQFVCVGIWATFTLFYSNRMKNATNTANTEVKQRILLKLHAMKKGILQVLVGQTPLVTCSIVFLFLGSMPFFWCICFVTLSSVPFSITSTTLGLFKKESIEEELKLNNQTMGDVSLPMTAEAQ